MRLFWQIGQRRYRRPQFCQTMKGRNPEPDSKSIQHSVKAGKGNKGKRRRDTIPTVTENPYRNLYILTCKIACDLSEIFEGSHWLISSCFLS
ncbi:hypothetical protein GWI33_013040 [Rhynchophorus ferrugineus]|uniref:Uncharacterized protein n=1 Tax=Rhynchophorus ferrugineus TaxID=354439 RepID=A0A834IA65_RHYFE|nr:hypothetical protein GWI33_013040 [Rhynchophorus ferrugineus]